MKLNCKPGDLAIIVVPKGISGSEHAGKIVRVTTLRLADSWNYEPSLPRLDGGFYLGIVDEYLRPIRDPGDDAVDETLLLKPVPFPQLEAV